jgi:hypothetical protein
MNPLSLCAAGREEREQSLLHFVRGGLARPSVFQFNGPAFSQDLMRNVSIHISEAARQILGVTDFPHVSTSEPKRIRHALCMSVPAGIGCGEEGVFRCLDLQI